MQDNIIVAITGKTVKNINFVNAVKVYSNIGNFTIEFLNFINKDMKDIFYYDFIIVINDIYKIENLKLYINNSDYINHSVLEIIIKSLVEKNIEIDFIELLHCFKVYKYLDKEKHDYIHDYPMFNNKMFTNKTLEYRKKQNKKYNFVNVVNFWLTMFLACIMMYVIYNIFSYTDE